MDILHREPSEEIVENSKGILIYVLLCKCTVYTPSAWNGIKARRSGYALMASLLAHVSRVYGDHEQ
jgi:hypothetical protein